jgi:Putative zinc-finger
VGRLISCKDASRLISQMQDGDLPFGQRLRVRVHLLFCDACTQFERQIRYLREVMRRYTQ